MMLVPVVLFVLSTIPTNTPSYFFKINSLYTSFLWNKGKPCMSLLKLIKDKQYGGVNFPDFQTYHNAFCLTHPPIGY